MSSPARTVSFTQMKNGTKDDYALLQELEKPYLAKTAERILDELRRQGDHHLKAIRSRALNMACNRPHGQKPKVPTLTGSSARSCTMWATDLPHKTMTAFQPKSSGRLCAGRCPGWWTHHGIFQMLYYAHHYGWDNNARDRFKDHPCFETCATFCERWDQASFDPDYQSEPLDHFEPMLREVFARKAYEPAIVQEGVAIGM